MISIIIPTYNEEAFIAETIRWIREKGNPRLITEIIVSDGGSADMTVERASAAGARTVCSPRKGRAAQMNYGATAARGSVLYFLHADTFPPENFTEDIVDVVNRDVGAGCYMLSFDHDHWFLRANCWFTRFDLNALRFGDQSLFVQKEVFNLTGGFNEKYMVLEDQELVGRLRKLSRFMVLKKPVITSARKYLENGIYKTQGIFFIIYFLYRLGYSQQNLVSVYRQLIQQDKL